MNIVARRLAETSLRRSASAYDALVAHVLRVAARDDDERTLRWLGLAASVAWMAHPGRFADERLEAVALQVGRRLQPADAAPQPKAGAAGADAPRRVLHVATRVYEVGGHARLIENWIKKDLVAVHSLILLDQRDYVIRPELVDLVATSGGELVVAPPAPPLLDRARLLRRTAQSGYDIVVLHHHPDDVVPTVALAVPDCPPVAVMNHADHVFWLGVSVADAVIDFRSYGERMSRERRGARRSMTFPLPIEIKPPAADKATARRMLGIGADQVVLLSIGAAYKYAPTPDRSFFATMGKLLAANPDAHLYLIGVGPQDLSSFGVPPHERISLLGLVNDPSLYQVAADLYLEGFPLNSYTALLETAALAVCPVLMYAPPPPLDLSGEASLRGLVTAPADEDAYLRRIKGLIDDLAARARLAEAVARRIASVNGGDIGATYLQPIYEQLAALTHQPSPPASASAAATDEDLDRVAHKGDFGIRTVLAGSAPEALVPFTVGDIVQALSISVRTGDTRPSLRHFRNWLGVLRRTVAASRSGGGVRR